MSNQWSNPTSVRRSCLPPRGVIVLLGALLANDASLAAGDNLSVVRDLASRVGPIIGSALACQNIARPRVQVIIDKFQAVIREASSNEAERADVARQLDRYVSDGRSAVAAGKTDCRTADRQVADLEQSLGGTPSAPSGPSLADAIAPPANAAVAPTQPLPGNVHGVTDREIRFGIVIPFSGSAKDNGKNMK